MYCDALNMLLLTLRGTPCTYYGEELGLQEIKVTFHQTQDPWGRNFGPVSRLPLFFSLHSGLGNSGCE